MPEPSAGIAVAIRALLEGLLSSSPEALSEEDLRDLAAWLLERAAGRHVEPAATEGDVASPPSSGDGAAEAARATSLRPLRIGGNEVVIPVVDTSGGARPSPAAVDRPIVAASGPARDDMRPSPGVAVSHVDQFDWGGALRIALERLELKAEACRLVVEVGRPEERADDPRREWVAKVAERARTIDGCWIWAIDPEFELPDDWQVDLCARAYENLEECLRIVTSVPDWAAIDAPPPRELLQDVAEAQSALRAALLDFGLRDDVDQFTAFSWVREQARENQVYVERHMRVDDAADPGRWGDLAERLVRWRSHVDAKQREGAAAREEHRLLGKLRFEAGKIAAATSESERCERWSTVVRTLDEWIAGGRPPSNVELCDLLEGLVEDLPSEVVTTDAADLVFRAVAQRAALVRSSPSDAAEVRRPGPMASEARKLLSGRVMVMLGGERRAVEEQRLCEDLGLRELRWIGTRAHRSLDPLAEQILRPEVDLVVMLVRFSDHAFADLREMTERAGKVWVRARGGYGSERIAHEILEQASGRLGGSAPR
ncbi:MAG: hypothetical protein R3F34_04590 [Planctomycetota bacterium]